MPRRLAFLVMVVTTVSGCGPGEHAFSAAEASCVAVADRRWYAAAEGDVRQGLMECLDTSGWEPLDPARPDLLSFDYELDPGEAYCRQYVWEKLPAFAWVLASEDADRYEHFVGRAQGRLQACRIDDYFATQSKYRQMAEEVFG